MIARIGESVRSELGRFGPTGAMAAIVEAWPAAVGEAIARNAWPARLARDGTLHVHAGSAAWAFELGQLRGMLLERLRARLAADAPASLRFALGPLPSPLEEPAAEVRRKAVEPTEAERREAEALVSGLDNADLRALVARAAAASLARTAADRSF